MKYQVTIAGRTLEIDVQGEAVLVDGERHEAHASGVPGTPLHHLLLDGVSWTVAAQALDLGAPSRWAVGLAGERWEVEVVDERTRAIRAQLGAGSGRSAGGVVKAPMPGLVVRVEVAPGQVVARGDGLVVVEAMKMENELKAPGAGRVVAVHVAAGAKVEQGAPLVTLEPSG
ncbi:MAG: biotin/lipoyl-containing protein [Gemmatimonadales bacterium]